MSNKTRIEVEGFDYWINQLSKYATPNVAIEKALNETHKIITKKAEEAIRTHKLTGATERSLKRDANIEWVGDVASVETGFSISQGGLASIFLIYGTPRMKKDQKLYNAFWSKKTHEEVIKAQEDIFFNEVIKGKNGG